ncbi:UNVERIFIED_CONTAM: hypothetical protein GTU68_065595 [Idotea baltica]|nr:hypothetical protein [Idotea baltica]
MIHFFPPSVEKMVAKLPDIVPTVDIILGNLEDGVPAADKEAARAGLIKVGKTVDMGSTQFWTRLNSLDSPWFLDDIYAAVTEIGDKLDVVMIPKVEGPEDIHDAGGASAEVKIWAMIETPTAIFDARSLAAHPRVDVLVMGTNDLAKELRADASNDRSALLPHLSTALLAAREAGKVILDGVYNDIKNVDGFTAECAEGAKLGFDGKTLIHPGQVEIANNTWAPDADEIDYAKRVIEAFTEAEADGRGVVTVDGRMIENLHGPTQLWATAKKKPSPTGGLDPAPR